MVKRKLNEAIEHEVSSALTIELLRRQRVMVIVDRLSERSQPMRDHVRTLQGNSPVRALIVTTRSPTGFEGADALNPSAAVGLCPDPALHDGAARKCRRRVP